MHRRLLACLLGIVTIAMGQTQSMTVQQLISFVRSEQKLIQEGKDTERRLAGFLANVRLTEKLDASVVEDLQSGGAGALTLKALQKLQEQSKGLKSADVQQVLADEPIPVPSAEMQGRILQDVREYVRNYDDSLPDFICAELEERSIAGSTRGTPSYRPVDTITSKLTYFSHHEVKTPILHNNEPISGDYSKLGGATSQGDFANMLQALFSPDTQARFEWARWATLRDHRTMVFRFHVDRERSAYKIQVPDQKLETIAAYSGEVFVDEAPPHAVTALVTKAENLPADFPIQRAETRLDYRYVNIGDRSFLLPLNEEVQLDTAGQLTKNSNTFKGYRKYEVGSEISFEIPKDMAVNPAASLQESPAKPAVDCHDPKNKDLKECRKQ